MKTPDGLIGPVNLGNPVNVTVIELADRVVEPRGSISKLVLRPTPFDDPHQRKPNIDPAELELNEKPKVPLDDSLLPTISHIDALLNGSNPTIGPLLDPWPAGDAP